MIPVTWSTISLAKVCFDGTHPQACWKRSVETLTARKDDIAGLAVASDEQIEAYLLYYMKGGERSCRCARSSRTVAPVWGNCSLDSSLRHG